MIRWSLFCGLGILENKLKHNTLVLSDHLEMAPSVFLLFFLSFWIWSISIAVYSPYNRIKGIWMLTCFYCLTQDFLAYQFWRWLSQLISRLTMLEMVNVCKSDFISSFCNLIKGFYNVQLMTTVVNCSTVHVAYVCIPEWKQSKKLNFCFQSLEKIPSRKFTEICT